MFRVRDVVNEKVYQTWHGILYSIKEYSLSHDGLNNDSQQLRDTATTLTVGDKHNSCGINFFPH